MRANVITIPEYYKKFIDSTVDLVQSPKQCCPFHVEDTPSFVYSPDKHIWRCFGACKIGGDVVTLHQVNFKLKNRHEAEKSLYDLLGIKLPSTLNQLEPILDKEFINSRILYNRALTCAKSIDEWLELDYIMSQYPVEDIKLQEFINRSLK